MATKVKAKDSSEAAAMLGLMYLDGEDFMKAIHDPERHRSLPYTLADIQHQIDSFSMEPEQLFEMYAGMDHREWMTIVNRTINEATKKKKAAKWDGNVKTI